MFRVHFFEEFPTPENLAPAKDLTQGIIYLAAHSFGEFEEKRDLLGSINPHVEAAYWPLLRESYWFSPFSYPHELQAFYEAMCQRSHQEQPLRVLLDLELPLLQRRLFRENRPYVRQNRQWLERIFEDAPKHKVQLYTAEYPSFGGLTQRLLQRLGVSYQTERFPHQKIIMWYNSIIPKALHGLGRRALRHAYLRHGEALHVGLGTIAFGIFGNEPILSQEQFLKDLCYLQSVGVKDIVIFRLGGMTQPYWEILDSFKESVV
ncbi:MAG: hypothetical protein H6727_10615 [Myxococcales bacterium]|nr:hypothetical protein [Myxococcales bacterium]